MKTLLYCAVFGPLFAGLVVSASPAAEELVTVASRSGVTQSYLLRHDASASPKVAAVVFPGGDGLLNLRLEGDAIRFGYANNFLVRARALLQDAEIAVAVIDVPSDLLRRGYSDAFRQGPEHAADVRAVVAALRIRFKEAKIFLVGTSRGTVSAAYAGGFLGSAVDGIVLTSSVYLASRGGRGLSGFDFADLRVPVLLVHHVDDGCSVTPYRSAENLASKFPLVSVRGGMPAQSGPCEALSAHGYLGKEAQTIAAIRNWMLGRLFPGRID